MKLSSAHKAQLAKVGRVTLAGAMVVSSLSVSVATPANAALTSNTTTITDSRPTQSNVTYTVSFRPAASVLTAIAQVTVKFCTTSASFSGCVAPTGFDVTSIAGATAAGFNGAVGATAGTFTRTAANVIEFDPTTPAAENASHPHNLVLTAVTNPTSAGSYYAMIETYSDASGSTVIDTGTSAFAIVSKVDVSGRVAETLTFNLAGVSSGATCGGENAAVTSTASSVPFGNFASGTPRVACQTTSVATNAVSGYTTSVRHTNSGVSPIGGMCRQTATNCTADGGTTGVAVADSIVDAGLSGTAAAWSNGTTFGVGVNANGGQAHTDYGGNAAYKSMYNASVAVATSAAPTNATATTVKLKADVPATQTAGVYQNSFEYLVVPIF